MGNFGQILPIVVFSAGLWGKQWAIFVEIMPIVRYSKGFRGDSGVTFQKNDPTFGFPRFLPQKVGSLLPEVTPLLVNQ
jgi:hypothetical protein